MKPTTDDYKYPNTNRQGQYSVHFTVT